MGICGLDDCGRSAESCFVIALLAGDHLLIAIFQIVPNRFFESHHIGLGDDALANKLLFVNAAECRTLGDFSGDDGLGECRLIRLVVALAAVAIHVDHDVPRELAAELDGEKRGPVELHGVLAIHVQDGSFDHLGDIRGISRRARVGGHGGEADLVVDDDVDGAAGAVAGKLREIEHLRHRALTRECSITMEQQREHLVAVDFRASLAEHTLAGAHLALDNRVDRLEVARVCRQADAHAAIRKLADAFIAEVVFHIAIASDEVRFVIRRELVEHGGDGFADEVGQHVHASAMGHAHLDLAHAVGRAGFENRIEENHDTLAAFIGKPFFTEETFAQKILEGLRLQHPTQGGEFAFGSALGAHRMTLDPLAHPVTHGRVVDVHELETDTTRIGRLQRGHHVAQLHALAVAEIRIPCLAVEVRLGQAEFGDIETRIALRPAFQRVDVSLSVAERPVVVNQCHHPAEKRQIPIRTACRRFCGRRAFALQLRHAELESFEKRRPRFAH